MVKKNSRLPQYGGEWWTTGQVAALIGVRIPTVIGWINKGKIAADRVENGPRKIHAKNLIRFMLRNKIDVPQELLYAGYGKRD